ncbi:hypothetical protein AAFF_G00377730 [Aldrovandia affinis]|uniref:LRAT domain-containing protein n=1 Tax=Aldrovandia affinis TaxID=143900 RepID=A0AAD7WLZ6_9TELE|nr:hypothetical protein AAFF_G00377730 [Aldrovandia affinis]
MKAKSLVGHTLDYNITQFNCEHFVNYLRYGKPHSQQVKDGIDVAVGVLGAMALGAGLIYLVFGGGKEEENKNERRLRRY